MGLTLSYDLENLGWARLVLTDGSFRADIGVSYHHDSLRELAEAAKALKNGAPEARAVFVDAPGEFHLIVTQEDGGLVYEIQQYAGWESSRGPAGGVPEVLYQGRTTADRFVGEVRREMEDLLKQHKLGGYRKKWMNHEFPLDVLFHLQVA